MSNIKTKYLLGDANTKNGILSLLLHAYFTDWNHGNYNFPSVISLFNTPGLFNSNQTQQNWEDEMLMIPTIVYLTRWYLKIVNFRHKKKTVSNY